MPIPFLSAEQMVEVDRLMIEEFGITLTRMMENAGRSLADLTRRLAGRPIGETRVVVLCGTGGNGGGGLVAARHLSNWGADVTVLTTAGAKRFKPIPAEQLAILHHLPIRLIEGDTLAWRKFLLEADLILDALIGYSLAGSPRGHMATLISALNEQGARVISLDAPSGLDLTDGSVHEPTVRAHATLTLALPKTGFRSAAAKSVTGRLFLADISVPPSLYRKLGLEVGPLFAEDSIIPIPN